VTKRANKTNGPLLIAKSVKVRLTALPIMIFGGSPIKVAVPPILEAKT